MFNLPLYLLIAYAVLTILFTWFMLVLIRYAYISFFYRNKFYYLGYKSGILWIRNFWQAVKDDVLKKEYTIDIKERINLIKVKLKELVITPEIDVIKDNIAILDQILIKIKDIRKDEFLKLEEDTFDNINNRLQSLIWGNDMTELKKVIEEISQYIDELKGIVSTIDSTAIYGAISSELAIYTDEYIETKRQIISSINELEGRIVRIEETLVLLQNKKTEFENDTIKSLMKESTHGDSLVQSIKGDFKNLWHWVWLIIIIWLLLSLLLWDILLMYKLIYDLFAQQIRAREYFIEWYVSYELFGIIISLFLPILLLVMMDIPLRKAKDWKILGHIVKWWFILLSLVSFLAGFGYFIWTRITGWDSGSIETIMPFFLLPATLALAYGFDAISGSKAGFSPISAPLVIIPKSVIYSIYISWKHWQTSTKNKKQKNAIEKQIMDIKWEKNILISEISRNTDLIESMRDERDKKILSEVKEYINIEWGILGLDRSLVRITTIGDNAWTTLDFTKSIINGFNEKFEGIRSGRKNEVIKTEKRIQLLRKNIEDIEQWFEYAMKEKLTII